MNDFVTFNDWFTQKYMEKSSNRFWSFKVALNLLINRGGRNIVETGTTRMLDDWGGGMSTVLFGDVAAHYDKHVWTCDILPEAIEVAKVATGEFKDFITYVVDDSLHFIDTFYKKIDLLYLDSLDCPEFDEPTSPNLVRSQEHQLLEMKLAWNKIHDKTIILLDDNGFSNGGKPALTRKFLEEQGWVELISHQQSLWIKN